MAPPKLHGYNFDGLLLGSWCSFRSGQVREAQQGWQLAHISLTNHTLIVSNRRHEQESSWKIQIPFEGTKVEALLNTDRPFVIQLTLTSVSPEIKHLFAFSSQNDVFIWIRSLAPFLHNVPPLVEFQEGRELSPVFGQPLLEVIKRDGSQIPLVVETCIEFLQMNNAHEEEGIFRRSGSKFQVIAIKEQFDKNKTVGLLDCGDPHVVAGVLKLFLQELPEPLIPYDLFDNFLSLTTFEEKDHIAALNSIVALLPVENQWLLSLFCSYFSFITQYESKNLMNLDNLAIVFAPSILRKKDATPQEEVMYMAKCKQAATLLFRNYPHLSINRSITEDARRINTLNSPNVSLDEDEPINAGILVRQRLPLITSHFIRTEGQSGPFTHPIQCGDTNGERLEVGTDVGLAVLKVNIFTNDRNTRSERKIEHKWAIVQHKMFLKVFVIDELNITLAICGTNSRLGAFHLSKDGVKYEKFRGTKGCHNFSYCKRNDKHYVIAAVRTNLLLFSLTKYEDDGTFQFTLKKEYYTPSPCCVLKFYDNDVLLGFKELKEFHVLDTETSQIEQLCGSQNERIPKDVLFLPEWNEYFVCFNDIGLFLSAKTFQKTRRNMVYFEDEPHSIVPIFPHYILAISYTFVTVLRITDGAVIQKIEILPLVENSATKRSLQSMSTDGAYLLLQEGTMVKVWKKRWFILNGGVLFYFKDEKDDTVLGAIMLKNAELKEGGKILRKKNTLCILDEGKRYFLSTDDSEELEKWKNKIQRAIGEVDWRMSTFMRGSTIRSEIFDEALDIPDFQKLSEWTVDNVSTWLKSVDFSDVVPVFREHEVDGKKLITFSKETAKALGISIGKRLVLLKRIQLLRESAGMGSETEEQEQSQEQGNVQNQSEGSDKHGKMSKSISLSNITGVSTPRPSISSVSSTRSGSIKGGLLTGPRLKLLTGKNFVFITCNQPGSSELYQVTFSPELNNTQ